ncbi:MAG TPA: FapA family protein [Bacillota bacterium]|nr:FapA family protein [Bacillota bacterium]
MKWPLIRAPKAPVAAGEAAPPASPEPSLPVASADGAVWIEDGSIRVRNPEGLGRWPTLAVPEGWPAELLVNGTPVVGEMVVRAEDAIELSLEVPERSGRGEVRVAPDGMGAWLTVHDGIRQRIDLQAMPPALRLALAGVLALQTIPHGLTAADAIEVLTAAGVTAGVDAAAIEAALATPGRAVAVAAGAKPREGRDGRAWSVVGGEITAGAAPDPSADLGRAGARPYVEMGQPVALVEPGQPGADGWTVAGEAVPSPPAWQPTLECGPGVLPSADGRTAIAGTSGHPEVTVDGAHLRAAVYVERQIEGDVATDVAFAGDIWIGGDILQGVTVRADGGVEVRGRVVRARVEAGGSIRVHGGATAAVLVAGGHGLLYRQALADAEELTAHLPAGAAPIPPAARRAAARLRELLAGSESELDPEVAQLLERLGVMARTMPGTSAPNLAGETAAALTAAVARMRATIARPGGCYARYLENTRLEATGSVMIGQQGAYRSHVVTLGSVRCIGGFRGGSCWSAGGAAFATLGSRGEVMTRVEVGASAPVTAAQVLPGTLVVRGKEVREFEAPVAGLRL